MLQAQPALLRQHRLHVGPLPTWHSSSPGVLAARRRPRRCEAQGPVGTGPSPVPPPQQLPEQDIDPNIWSYKPPWCQPVTIVGTGAAFVAGVWAVSGGSAGWTAASAVPIVIWWYLFLGIMPAEFREYAESMNRQRQVQRLNRQREESGEQGGPE